jgi:cytochrome c peroxidase
MKTCLAAALALVLGLTACQRRAPESAAARIDPVQLALFAPLPPAIETPGHPVIQEQANLGRMLFYETGLSRDHDLSCNSCHSLTDYGVDHQTVSNGAQGQRGTRNAPTVYNAAGHIAQFWDGRAATIEEQAKGPILNPVEMAMPSDWELMLRLSGVPAYVAAFRRAFPGQKNPVTYDNVARAIGAFERRLVTPSPWDAFLEGDQNALTAAEKEGFNSFIAAGCHGCHNGAYLGGQTYQKAGLVTPWPDVSDPGRSAVTRHPTDRMVFKVPSLRNVAMTEPYFHNGRTQSLGEAVRIMGRHQLGRELTSAQVQSIVAYLETLTGAIPLGYVAKPQSPPSN